MATSVKLYGIDRKRKECEIDISGTKFEGWVYGPNTADREAISELAGRFGLDGRRFLMLFRQYPDDYWRGLTSEEKSKLTRESSVFIWELDEVRWMRDFSREMIGKIEANADMKAIWEKRKNVPGGGNIHDYLNDFEYKCYDAWGSLHNVLAVCEKALELGVKIQVIK